MSLFDRLRKKPQLSPQKEPPGGPVTAIPDKPGDTDDSLRAEIGRLYDCGVDPVHAIRATLHGAGGTLTTDAKRLAGIWLGVNDLLDRDVIGNPLRSELVSVRNVLAKTIEDAGEGPKIFVRNYRENTRRINKMKFLQAYKSKLVDAAGVMQLEAIQNMLAEIEHERASNPGSLAQDISDEKLASLYSLRDNWDDPSKLM